MDSVHSFDNYIHKNCFPSAIHVKEPMDVQIKDGLMSLAFKLFLHG
jgi:hypothetical protein